MLKHSSSISVGGQLAIISAAVVLCALLQPAYGQMNDPALLLQQSPAEGGTITPAVGVHQLELGSEITLTAVPRPGYQFVYWMGDVSDPVTNRTTVHIDAPKIVIAVFERSEFELLFVEGPSHIRPGGGLVRTAAGAAQGGFGGPGAKRPSKFRWPRKKEEPPEPPEDEEGEYFPVPEGGEDFPVPIPEPATVCLLGLGSLVLLRKRRALQKRCNH